MPDVLIYSDTVRSPELRHEVPLLLADPFLYVEKDGVRHLVVSSMEIPRLEGMPGLALHAAEEFGVDELRRNGTPAADLYDLVSIRAVHALGVTNAVVPPSFPILMADLLRAAGVELTPDRELFDTRRRCKSGAELAGIRRAQAAAEAGMTAARALLRRASAGDGGLDVDGAPLTSERVKAAILAEFLAHGATADEFVVSHGAQSAIGHHMGSGRLQAGETIVIDLWPRDNESGCSADMTRTFVIGEVPAEVAEWHRLCKEVLDRSIAEAQPGIPARSLMHVACDIFEAAGYPTQRTKTPGEALHDGFFHSLGHGVGLEVHEQPLLGLSGHDDLVVGDVLAVEPGLYRPGFGGLRLEDLLLVTDSGVEHLTSFPYDLTP